MDFTKILLPGSYILVPVLFFKHFPFMNTDTARVYQTNWIFHHTL